MSEQRRKHTILQIFVPVAGIDGALYCYEIDFEKVVVQLSVPGGAEMLGQGIMVGATHFFHIRNVFQEIEDPITSTVTGKALGQINIYGTCVTRPVQEPKWWKDCKHEKPGLGNIIKLE